MICWPVSRPPQLHPRDRCPIRRGMWILGGLIVSADHPNRARDFSAIKFSHAVHAGLGAAAFARHAIKTGKAHRIIPNVKDNR